MNWLFSIFLTIFMLSSVQCKAGWSGWSEWSSWGKGLCSGNKRIKTRSCTNPLPTSGNYCHGENSRKEDGPIDGGLSDWTQWSTCEKPCGGSIVNRTRVCDNPPPSRGGSQCFGKTVETKMECVMPCPESKTDGSWSPWSDWSSCPKQCTRNGGSLIKRYRQCNMPPPMFGGKPCPGNSTEEIIGCFDVCPVDGGFSQWSSFTPCSRSCGTGFKSRYRLCNDPVPQGSTAQNCTGAFNEAKHCRLAICEGAVNGKWGSWSQWSSCSQNVECFKGVRSRKRSCSNPAPSKGGDDCLGSADETEICPKTNCKDNKPTQSPTLPVYPGDYIHRECGGVSTKKLGSTAPSALLNNVLSFEKTKFMTGYYGEQKEEKDSIIKYCFEPYPPLTIREATNKVKSYNKSTEIPNFKRPSVYDAPTLGFSVRVVNDGKYTIKGWDFGISEVDEYIPGKNLKMEKVMFTYYSEGIHHGFLAKGQYQPVKNFKFDSVVFHNDTLFHSTMQGTGKDIGLRGIFGALGIPADEDGSIKALERIGFWNIKFSPVSVSYDFKVAGITRITATKTFNGIPLHFEILFYKDIVAPKIAFGFAFDGESFGAVMDKLSGSGGAGNAVSTFLNAFGVQPEIGIAYCPILLGDVSLSNSKFTKQPLASMFSTSVAAGLHAAAQLSIPKDCKGVPMCTILKKLVGPGASFKIQGYVGKDAYSLTAGFYKIRLYKEFYMSKLQLALTFNSSNTNQIKLSFGIEFQIPVNTGHVMLDGIKRKAQLNFGGLIDHEIGTSAVSGALYMRGVWKEAFGVDWLSFGNINLGLSLDAALPTVVAGFQLGATVEIGVDCYYAADFANDGHCLSFAIYFAVGKPSYFYGKVSALTIGKIARMVGGKGGLPGPVASSGFPEGLMVSFNSGDPVDLRYAGGPVVPEGFVLRGTLDLFGYQIKAWIALSKTSILIDGELDPINLGGHVIMARNATHKHVGPKLYFNYKQASLALPYFKMYFEGYVKILGIEIGAFLNITMEAMEIHIYGKVWNLIYCDLYVSSSYDYRSIKDAHFYIRVIVDLRGLTDAIEKARRSVDQAFKAAQKHLRSAISHVQRQKQKCKEKMTLKCNRCHNIKCKETAKKCKGFLDDLFEKLNPKNWWRRRKRRSLARQQRNEYFALHLRKKRFTKFFCEKIVGGACQGIAYLCEGSCNLVSFIGRGLCHTLDIAVGVLKFAEAASGWINSAIQFLLQMFLVHGIRFELGLGQKFNGFMVGAAIDLTLFGNRMYFEFQFDLKNPVRSITNAKDGSLYRYKKGVRQLRTELTFNPYDNPNPFSDFDLGGTFGIEALNTGDENRLGACLGALTTKDNGVVKLLPCNETDERQRWLYTLDGKLINLYSKKCIYFGKSEKSGLTQYDCQKGDKTRMQHGCELDTRTIKLRREDLCLTMKGKASNKGPGAIAHHGSMKCIHVGATNRLVLRSGCHRVEANFQMTDMGHIKQISTNRCLRPANGQPMVGAKLELTNDVKACHQFEFTSLGSIRHAQSRLCIQPANMEMNPHDYTELILGSRCDHTQAGRSSGSPADQELTFTFIPQENSLQMERCASFYGSVAEQNFVVMGEETNPVCSKFSKNLAYRKAASQSSIKHNGFPSRAVDGNFNFQWEKGSCMHTNEERDPWWRVDLGKEYIVTDITIMNRGEHGERFNNVQVHVGQYLDIKSNPVCHERIVSSKDGEVIRLSCDPPIPGRFLSVQMYGKGILSMCEVVVASRLGGMTDLCQVENGGCEHICSNKCGKELSCSCLPGYRLAYDGRSCIDINECLSNNGGCRVDKQARCINYPGGFYCGCNRGYILADNSLTECVDLNECGSGNGGCEQMCNNTLGGYMCTCRKGFERKPNNPYGCQDINECLSNNGGCDHNCHDYQGGHYCSCKVGFRLRKDGKACEELFCPVLEAPYHGHVTPATCSKKYENIAVGSTCKFECSKGFELKTNVGAQTLSCRIDGTWDHGTPNCHPVKCPTLQRPINGGLVPARCHDDQRGYNEFGQRCVTYCRHGYRLRGAPTKYCQANKSWSNNNGPLQCVKIIEPPYVNCPTDIQVTLPNNANQISLGSKFQQPQSNVNSSMITSYPDNVGPDYKFRFGKTLVSYVAMANGQQVSCSYFVDVKDSTPPTVSDCPKDIIQNTGRLSEIITWAEPKFSDNVGVRRVMGPVRKPGEIWYPGEEMIMQYVASDIAGNQKKCSFKVALKAASCPKLYQTDDAYLTVTPITHQKLYSAHCQHARTLFGNYDPNGVSVRCRDGDYHIQTTNIGHSFPDCVDYHKISKTQECTEGFQRFTYVDWFYDTIHFCSMCPSGTFWNNATRTCKQCIVGEYQDDHGMSTCETCPLEKSTLKTGSKSIKDCYNQCLPGSYSSTGLDLANEKCALCPKGTFSYLHGSTECTVCPGQSTTDKEGTALESKCTASLSIVGILPLGPNVSVKRNFELRLSCYFEGSPVPDATWLKEGGNLPNSHRLEELFDMHLIKIGISLVVPSVSTRDAGKYTCIVKNKNGNDHRAVNVKVV
uniref:Hemicentin-1 n=2 Tax=Clytia hemisphaerica TaxID=252671 RepID=A0A7M5WWB1_9CNID